MPLVFLDVPLDSRAEREFAAALAGQAPEVVATVPNDDNAARDAFLAIGGALEVAPDVAAPDSDLANLRRYVFTMERPERRERVGDVQLFSAPGEGREAIEIVRRALDEAERGVPFDQMAVFLRAPQQYLGVLEHACTRGGVPAYFDRGTRLPDPGGRAFVALVACAAEGLSARRFDEYLSLAQVPRVGTAAVGADTAIWPRADEFPERRGGPAEADEPETSSAADPVPDSDDEAVVAGSLRSPWKWEELIVESAVVGGRSREEGKLRWRRRLGGLASDYAYRIAELEREEPESPTLARLQRDLRNLSHLREFALPIVDMLAEWPELATWGEWLDRFAALATRALKQPVGVLQLLAELRPMADVGPIGLEQAAEVLRDRLTTLDRQPPRSRYGKLFVGTPHQARGRSFRVVFVPGLAERLVPQRPREDPLLLDDRRHQLAAGLLDQDDRGRAERLLLHIAIGAASERLHLSYPRLDVAEARARVPSFYALDVMRAITGSVPDHRVLAAQAAEAAGAYLAWPAPARADRAIDDLEHDLASLRPLLLSREPATVKGRAHYLLGLNDALRRSIVSRWSRSRRTWAPADGVVASMPALERHRLGRRPYSLSALQRFASCPYQFLLATIHRLEPRQDPEPLLRMDPLTRGSLFHAVQAAFFRALEGSGRLPVTRAALPDALRTLDLVLAEVSGEYEERLAPAIDRVWRDEIEDLRRDLGIWVQRLADDDGWRPSYFELSFGLGVGSRQAGSPSGAGAEPASHALRAPDPGAPRDPRSLPDPVVVDGRFILRGSVDLIERHRDVDVLRITDHKTGKNRTSEGLIVGGGAVLQPVLYGLAIEQGLGTKVTSGRLFYCTTAGGFTGREIPLNDYTRGQGLQVLEIIDRAVADGFIVAAPAPRACTWCDFRSVCGPREEARVSRKAKDRLADLDALRSMR
jgi:CRISPR/Cas system-associated exonuclease Cas4 (RecB family)